MRNGALKKRFPPSTKKKGRGKKKGGTTEGASSGLG